MKVGELFAGIGGFGLGLERSGMKVAWQVEKDDFCNKVLAKHWPDVKRYGDIYECGKHNLESVDLICGGFPCTPFSQAGKRRGKEDDRYLWPEMVRIISELKPRWVIGENVVGILNMGFEDMLSALGNIGYEIEVFVIPACAVDAQHRRDRVWIVANTNSGRWLPGNKEIQHNKKNNGKREISSTATGEGSNVSNSNKFNGNKSRFRTSKIPQFEASGLQRLRNWESEPGIRRVVDGVPNRLHRLKCLGNAVVPQIVEVIGKAILETEK